MWQIKWITFFLLGWLFMNFLWFCIFWFLLWHNWILFANGCFFIKWNRFRTFFDLFWTWLILDYRYLLIWFLSVEISWHFLRIQFLQLQNKLVCKNWFNSFHDFVHRWKWNVLNVTFNNFSRFCIKEMIDIMFNLNLIVESKYKLYQKRIHLRSY